MRPIVCTLVLLVPTLPGWSQQALNPDPRLDAIAELRCLRTLTALQITKEQAAGIIGSLADLGKQQTAYAKWAGDTWATSGQQIQAAIRAWSGGTQPGEQQMQVALTAFRDYLSAREALDEAAATAGTALLTTIGAGPELAESREAALVRKDAERHFGGARNAAEFILSAAEALRLLMPDDYHLVRFSEAQRLARTIADTPGPPPQPLVDNVLRTLDDLMNVAPQALVAERAGLLAEIGRRLGLQLHTVIQPAVDWDQLMACLKSPQVFQVLHALAGTTPPATPLTPQGFEGAMAQIGLIAFTSDLQLRREQAAALGQIMAEMQRGIAAYKQDVAGLGEQALPLMATARQALTSGQPLDAQTADRLQALLEEDAAATADLKVAMVRYLSQVRRILGPPQRDLVDWTPPGDVQRLVPPTRMAEGLRERAGIIAGALDFINSIKYTTGSEYPKKKVQFSLDYVAQFYRPDTPPFQQALDFTLQVVTDARGVELAAWQSGVGVEYATRLAEGLGLLRDTLPSQPTGNELYTWQDLCDLLLAAVGTQPPPSPQGGQQ